MEQHIEEFIVGASTFTVPVSPHPMNSPWGGVKGGGG